MNKLRNMILIALAVFVIPAAGAVADGNSKTLEEQIRKEILTMPDYGLFDIIGFEIKGDTVILTGKLYNGVNRKVAEKRVARLKGVSRVVNNIELLPASSFDDRIRRNTVREIARTGGIYRYLLGPNPAIRIIVDGGNLTLEGTVADKSDIRLMNIVAQGVPNVFSVTNNLVVSNNVKY